MFLEITERRNLFVHTGGEVSSQYLDNCNKYKLPVSQELKEGSHLSASDKYILSAFDCFYELCVRITQAVARRLYPQCYADADNILNNKNVDLLNTERWNLAENIFEYALDIPEELTSKGETKYYFLINLCIALKFGGKDYLPRLHSVDWTPFHPKYHFAVAVLEDRYDDAEKLMRKQAVIDQFSEMNFKEWPLLREFRKTDQFRNAFQDIFHKDFELEMIQEVGQEMVSQETEKFISEINDLL